MFCRRSVLGKWDAGMLENCCKAVKEIVPFGGGSLEELLGKSGVKTAILGLERRLSVVSNTPLPRLGITTPVKASKDSQSLVLYAKEQRVGKFS